ncbi:MAG TPA: VOC family protein [Hyphomonadaceae bacterium]|nr:VOC family protein [Hyphomonadaceae bacterium]HPI47973.1 VOC family protein [Hyphomonadaceae bacterium]
MKTPASFLVAALMLGACASPVPPSDQDLIEAWRPIIKGARLHHVHLNVTDRKEAIAYYLKHVDARAETFAGEDAIWVQRSWILFNEVKEKPAPSAGTGINHIGWGAPDPRAEFERQKALGATFDPEITDIGVGLGGPTKKAFSFMYLIGPNGEIIELNTDEDDNFGHIHFYNRQPHTASDWYGNMFGLAESNPVFPGQAAHYGIGDRMSRRHFGNVNTIFSLERGEAEIKPTTGTVIDHIGISVPNLDAAMAAIKPYNVTILAQPATGGPGWRHAFIEGPDRVAIELIQDHTPQPKITD